MNIEMMLSGVFFLVIIITNLTSDRFGYETFSRLDAGTKLLETSTNQKHFKISFVTILIEHISIIMLAAMLFLTFSSYNLVLAIVWTVSRSGEGLIQIYNKISYWRLLGIASQYSVSSGADKNTLVDSAYDILKTKNTTFTYAQILFSIGTLAYSILFVVYEILPAIIGWFGLVSSVLYGMGNGIILVRPDVKVLWNIGGLLILLFELTLGGWLIYLSLI